MTGLSDFSLIVEQHKPIQLNARLECAAGQMLALLGPSGSGKSTLLRMAAGLGRPQAGRISCGKQVWFDGAGKANLPPQQRHVGYVPQHYGLFPHMTALQNICAALHRYDSREQQRRAHEWLQRTHLDGLQHRRPHELSGGQQQRVALARALAGEPSILLLDEPFSAVDSMTRERLHGELAELKSQLAIPVILVTHDLDEALSLADSMTLINHGKTLQAGPPHAVLARPVNEEAAQMLGLRNVFDGEIVAHDIAQNCTSIRFGPALIESPLRPELLSGRRVRWVIADHGVRFRPISKENLPAQQNRLQVGIEKILVLGEQARLVLTLDDIRMQVNIPLRLARELELAAGELTQISLRKDAIHIFAE